VTGIHRKRKRTTTNDGYAAMLARMLRAYGTRIGEEPATGLAHLRELEQAMTDATNLGLYTANRDGGHSVNQLAAMLGISKQSVHARVKAGERIAAARARRPRPIPGAAKAAPRALERPGETPARRGGAQAGADGETAA
jgi:hypothetical protein